MRLRRNQQRTTTSQSSFRNQKIRKSSHHNRRHRPQRKRHGTPSTKNESLPRLRRNRQKRTNHTPRRPQRPNSRLPLTTTRLPKRQHRSPITQQSHTLTGAIDHQMGTLNNFREVVGNLKHQHTRPKLCPRCHSTKLRLSSRFDMWLFPEQYICPECGYKGPIVLELEEQKQETTEKSGP